MESPIRMPIRNFKFIAILLGTPLMFIGISAMYAISHFQEPFNPNTLKGFFLIILGIPFFTYSVLAGVQIYRVTFILNPRIKNILVHPNYVSFPYGIWKRKLVDVKIDQIKDVLTGWTDRNKLVKSIVLITDNKSYSIPLATFKNEKDAILFLTIVSKGKIKDLSPWKTDLD